MADPIRLTLPDTGREKTAANAAHAAVLIKYGWVEAGGERKGRARKSTSPAPAGGESSASPDEHDTDSPEED